MSLFAEGGHEAVLDDSVSEEDGSFDELTDVSPYLQSGVELSALNEVCTCVKGCVGVGVMEVACCESLFSEFRPR